MNNNINRLQSSLKVFQSQLSINIQIASFASSEALVNNTSLTIYDSDLFHGEVCRLVEFPSVVHSENDLLRLSNCVLLSHTQSHPRHSQTDRLSVSALTSSYADCSYSSDASLTARCYITVEDVQLAPVGPLSLTCVLLCSPTAAFRTYWTCMPNGTSWWVLTAV